jgi:hypothetical protein
MMYTERYLPNAAADIEYTIDCIRAKDLESAIAIAQGHPKGDAV